MWRDLWLIFLFVVSSVFLVWVMLFSPRSSDKEKEEAGHPWGNF